jgi:hypothetical protein
MLEANFKMFIDVTPFTGIDSRFVSTASEINLDVADCLLNICQKFFLRSLVSFKNTDATVSVWFKLCKKSITSIL